MLHASIAPITSAKARTREICLVMAHAFLVAVNLIVTSRHGSFNSGIAFAKQVTKHNNTTGAVSAKALSGVRIANCFMI